METVEFLLVEVEGIALIVLLEDMQEVEVHDDVLDITDSL